MNYVIDPCVCKAKLKGDWHFTQQARAKDVALKNTTEVAYSKTPKAQVGRH